MTLNEAPSPTIFELYDLTLKGVADGLTLTRSCYAANIRLPDMLAWLSQVPDGGARHAGLLRAEGDAMMDKSDRLRASLSQRVDDNLVRTPQMASVELAEIKRLRSAGLELRARADKLTPTQVAVPAPAGLAAPKSIEGKSWTDRQANDGVESTVERALRELDDAGL